MYRLGDSWPRHRRSGPPHLKSSLEREMMWCKGDCVLECRLNIWNSSHLPPFKHLFEFLFENEIVDCWVGNEVGYKHCDFLPSESERVFVVMKTRARKHLLSVQTMEEVLLSPAGVNPPHSYLQTTIWWILQHLGKRFYFMNGITTLIL